MSEASKTANNIISVCFHLIIRLMLGWAVIVGICGAIMVAVMSE